MVVKLQPGNMWNFCPTNDYNQSVHLYDIKAYSINIDTHTSCLTASPDPPPLVSGLCRVCPESGLRIAWLQPPPALPIGPVCQQWQSTGTHCGDMSSAYTRGGHPGTDASSLTGRHVNLAIYLHFLPSALTHLTALWLLRTRAFAQFSIRTAI